MEATHQKEISFVILSWNSAPYLERCLDSIAATCAAEELRFEAIVIDNGSGDSSTEIVQRYCRRDPGSFRLIPLEKNRGTTYSRNLGLRQAAGEHLCILDSDAELVGGSLRSLFRLFGARPDLGIIAPQLVLPDGSVQNSVKRFPTFRQKVAKVPAILRGARPATPECYAELPEEGELEVETAISACWFFRRELLKSVGLLDERIFYSPEDLDFSHRVRMAGYRLIYLPSFKVLHHTQQISHKKPLSRTSLSHFFGLLYFYAKHGGWLVTPFRETAGGAGGRGAFDAGALAGRDIVMLSSDDWGWKTSKYQLATRFSRANRVLFVSSVGFRSATVSSQDMKRIWKKLSSFLKGLNRVDENLFVLTPLIIPWRGLPMVSLANRLFLRLQLYCALRRLRMGRPYLFVFSQNWLEAACRMKRKQLVYYCVDDHTGFQGIDAMEFQEKDRRMTASANLVICSSRKLYEQKKAINDRTVYLPHGVNYDLFSRSVREASLPVPPDITALPHPILGFYGHVSYEWVDVELIRYLAASRPGWTILLIGKYSLKAEEFQKERNVVVLGERDYHSLPAYCRYFEVGLIPFVKSQLTEHCNPLKLYEYLAAGIPVVSTEIPEVRLHADRVHVARDYPEFLECCERALGEGSAAEREARSLGMADSSWDARVSEIYRLLCEGEGQASSRRGASWRG